MTASNSRPQLVASDIGGTLIDSGGIIPEFTARVLNRLAQTGVPIVLITGYNHKTTLKFTRNLDDSIMRMPQNGTMCFRGKKKIWEYKIGDKEARDIYDYLEENNLPIIIYKGKGHQFQNIFKGPPEFQLSDAFERVDKVNDFDDITGISTLVPNDIALSVKEKIEDIIGDHFQLIYVRQKESSWLEILQSDVRKDLALKRLCKTLDTLPADVVYFGDNFNDAEVLRLVGHPVLVANAVPELKEEFDTIIKPVWEEGVAHYLNERFNLGVR